MTGDCFISIWVYPVDPVFDIKHGIVFSKTLSKTMNPSFMLCPTTPPVAAAYLKPHKKYVLHILIAVLFAFSPFSLCYALSLEIVPTTKRIFPSTVVTDRKDNLKIELWAGRNEFESAQIAMRSGSTVTVEKIDCTDLVYTKTGEAILRKHFEPRFVKYVYVGQNTKKTPPSELDEIAPDWFPDPFEEGKTLKFNDTRSLWVTWYVPSNNGPGDYKGALTIKTRDGVHRVPVVLHVWNFKLPSKPSLFVTNWLHINQIESQYRVKRGSPEFWNIIDKVAADMISHRQNVIFTPLNLVGSTKLPDGNYSFDFKDYERWIRIFLKRGFQAIEGSHLFHPGNSYNLYRYVNGKPVAARFDKQQLDTPEGKAYVAALLSALHRENVRLGIRAKYLQHVGDEPKPEQLALYREIATIVHRAMPGVPVIDAIDLPPDTISGVTDIQTRLIGRPVGGPSSTAGARWGKWWYTAMVPRGRYPNRFIDYPLVKMRVIPWLSWCNGVNGYLHYGYNWWLSPSGKPPQEDVDQAGKYPPGDGFIVYPPLTEKNASPVSSLRWEVFRDGLEDYEYVYLLKSWKDRYEKRKAQQSRVLPAETVHYEEAKKLLNEVCGQATHSENYSRDPAVFLNTRYKIGLLLNKVSN